VTAVAGQVLTTEGGRALPNVSLELNCGGIKKAVSSDNTGRFLLSGTPTGHCKLEIDGTTASRQGKTYGVYFAGVDIAAGKTNALPYIIWMTAIDTPLASNIPSPTVGEVVVTTPQLKGLELRLPPGATVKDYDGNVVKQLSITQIATGVSAASSGSSLKRSSRNSDAGGPVLDSIGLAPSQISARNTRPSTFSTRSAAGAVEAQCVSSSIPTFSWNCCTTN